MSSNSRVQVQISTILLLEDNADDKMLVTRAIKKTGKPIELHHAYDGAEGIECLAKLAQNGEYPQPGMILSDLKMPKMTGLEVLCWVRSQPWGANVPFVVLTSSDEAHDIEAVMAAGATAYIQKPLDYQDYIAAIAALHKYWEST